MTGWRGRLAAIRARHAADESAHCADSPAAEAIGTIGTNDSGMEGARRAEVEARVASYLAFTAEAAAALAEREPDPIEDAERAAVFDGDAGGTDICSADALRGFATP